MLKNYVHLSSTHSSGMKCILFICLVLTGLFSFAQKNQKINFSDFQKKEMEIPLPETTVALPYKAIHVIDKRADTGLIGFSSPNHSKSTTKHCLVLKSGTTNSITNFLNASTRLNPAAKTELLIVIRKLWLSREIEHRELNEPTKKEALPFVPGLIARFEIYAKNETVYVPLFRFDSTFKGIPMKKTNENVLLSTSLIAALQKIAEVDPEQKIVKGIKKTMDDIEVYSTIRPLILSAKSLKKGIYTSYDEFRNNNPSITDFEIRKDSKSSLLIAKDANGQEYPARKIWGFCDGEKAFIKSIDNFFELHFHNGSIYSRASKQIVRSSGNDSKILSYLILPLPIADGLDKSGAFEKYGITLGYYQLDPDLGILY